MAMQLMPYGSSHYLSLTAKISEPSKTSARFAPYGSTDYRKLATKVGEINKVAPSMDEARKVIRLNKARD